MDLLLIGLLSVSVIATVVLLVSWMFFRASAAGYAMDGDGRVGTVQELSVVAPETSSASDDAEPVDEVIEGPVDVDYFPEIDVLPAISVATDKNSPGEAFSAMPFLIIPRKPEVPASFVNGFLNSEGQYEGITYAESGNTVDVKTTLGANVMDDLSKHVILRQATISLDVPAPKDAGDTVADTIYADPLLEDIASAMRKVLEENPRVKPDSAATTRKVAAAYAEMFPSGDDEVGINVLSYKVEVLTP